MTYRITIEAKDDLERIWNYGADKFGVRQADKYYEGFFVQFEQIASFPLLFPKVEYLQSEIHKCVYGSDSIYYRIHVDGVEIMTIIGRQDLMNSI